MKDRQRIKIEPETCWMILEEEACLVEKDAVVFICMLLIYNFRNMRIRF
jgi:hypothetical protein